MGKGGMSCACGEGRGELWGLESSGSNGPEHKGDDGEHTAARAGGIGDDTGPLLEQDLWQALHREGNDQCALHALLGYRTGSVGCSAVRAGTWGHRPGGG